MKQDILKTPQGYAGFNILKEAKGFKGAEENKSFSIGVYFDKEEGIKFVDSLQAVADKLYAQEIEKAKAMGKNARLAPPMVGYKEMPDGRIRLNFKRREEEGAPAVLDANNQEFKGLVRSEMPVKIAFTVRPYVLASAFGISLKLLGVQVLENEVKTTELANIFGPSGKAKEQVRAADLF